MAEAKMRPVWAEIDLDAVRHNARALRRLSATVLCAVVKADGYGHGSVATARAALEGGANWLGVAVVEEGVELRQSGIEAPVLVLSEPTAAEMIAATSNGLAFALYTRDGIASAEKAAMQTGLVADVHLKLDSGMHRVGADPSDVAELARAIAKSPHLRLGSVWTHLAVADGVTDQDRAFTDRQIRLYNEVLSKIAASGIDVPMRHASNSAGAIAHPDARFDMVRCGIALYGQPPAPELRPLIEELGIDLKPVLSLKARVSQVRELARGERPSYGRRRALPEDSTVAVIPIGYADGLPRAYFDRGGSVLVGGRRRPLAGTVTMDQAIVDCGPGSGVAVGDEVVLIGSQGDETLTATDWAELLGTISYEVLCGIGPRVPRVLVDHEQGAEDEMDRGVTVGGSL
jgi:alanine racemase